MKLFDLFRSPRPGTSAKRAPLATYLEPRMLFDGAVAATVVDAASNNDHASADSSAKNTSTDDSSQHATDAATPPAATSDNRHEVVFVDGQVGNKQQIIDGLKPGTEVVVLDSNKDGLQQIADYLKDRSDIDAIHIISHGDTGKVQLGNAWVDNASLAARGEALSAIGKALSSDGDILLYGCTVGANGEGQDFIQALADKTGADVAASDDATGAASRGGDWVLERQIGVVETSALQFDAYSGLLANGIITFNSNDNGNWADGIAEDGNGGSTNLPGITVQISNVSDVNGTNLGKSLVYGDAQNADAFYAVTTYDISVQNTGWKGMQIRSADGSEFKLSAFDYWNYGEVTDTVVTVKGYRDGVEVASTTFTATLNGFFVQKSAAFDAAFGSVDSVILYTDNDSWHGLNNIQIADAVAPNAAPVTTTSGGNTAFTEGNNVTSTPVAVDNGITLSDVDNSTLASAAVSITGNFQSGQDVLMFTNDGFSMGNISANYSAGTGVMTLSSAGATATLAQWQAALRSVAYTNTSDGPNTGSRTISFVVSDSISTSNTATKIVTVASVNDTPIATSSGGNTAFTEGAAVSTPVVIDSGINLSDADSITLASAEVKITGNLHSGEDVLGFTNSPATMGNISGSYAAGTGILSLSSAGSTATLAQWQAALRSITYTNTSHLPDTSNRTISFTVSDSSSTSATTTKVVTVASVDTSPIASTSGGSTTYTEGTPVTIDNGISLSDSDSSTLASATVAITGNFNSAEDVLAFTNSNATLYGNIVGFYNAGTGVFTLSSSGATATVAQWQTAMRAVTYSNSSDSPNTANRTVSFTVNDGYSDSATATKVVAITAVNDAPVNSVPSSQNTQQDGTLIFNSGNGNLISVSDVDAGSNVVRTTLTATNGQLTLSGVSGLSFLVGSGVGDATMTFEGSLADINNALNGLTFTPNGGYNGAASIQITSNDLGASGSGGGQTDTDTVNITVLANNPVITSVSGISPNGVYGVGDTVMVTVNFSESVNVDTTGGTPSLALSSGRTASYLAGSGTSILLFTYTVQAGDASADLDYSSTSALALNGASIQSATSNNAVLTLAAPGTAGSLGANAALVIDGVAATVSSVSVPADGTYVAGQNMDFTVNLSENVTVAGTPRIAITLDTGGTVYADYLSGSGTSSLVFRLTVSSGQLDSNGITVGALSLNGGTLRDAANNNSILTLNSVSSTAGVLVDAVVPQVSGITLDNASPTNASSVSYTVTFSEDVSGVDISDFNLVAGGSVSGTLQSVVQINAQTYQVFVDGITGAGTLNLALNSSGTGITDSTGNAIATGFSGPGYVFSPPVVVPTPETPVVTPDPQFLSTPPAPPPLPQPLQLQPLPPPQVGLDTISPLAPPPLFEQPTIGSGIPTLGNIFINQNPLAPSFIAQVFTSSDSGGDGGGAGFLGFGGGDGGIFGSSSLSGLFNKESASDVAPIKLFDKAGKSGDANQGLRGVFGSPTLGAQLHQMQHHEQQQIQELATALGQLGNPVTPS